MLPVATTPITAPPADLITFCNRLTPALELRFNWIFVHAARLPTTAGRSCFPGRSFSGKTTLVAALVQAGASYYSDEYAVLDGDGRVHPYTRRLSIRGDGVEPTQERHVGELGGVAAEESAELSVVVVTRYRRDAAWQPTRLYPGEGMVALLANTVPARSVPRNRCGY